MSARPRRPALFKRHMQVWTYNVSAKFRIAVRIERVIWCAGRPHYVVALREVPDVILVVREEAGIFLSPAP